MFSKSRHQDQADIFVDTHHEIKPKSVVKLASHWRPNGNAQGHTPGSLPKI